MDGKTRLFVDMDGTLAVFNKVDTIELLFEKGYFLNLEPQVEVVESIKLIMENCPDVEVNILSSFLIDSKYAFEEKNQWLDRYLPEIDMEHRIFLPCGDDKKQYVENHNESCFLLDDYTKNLQQWSPPGKGIKLLNGINHTKGTWTQDTVNWNDKAVILGNNIINIIDNYINREVQLKNQSKKCKMIK